MCWSIKNIFDKNKIGKNDNTDIGNNKNNKVRQKNVSFINNESIESLIKFSKEINQEKVLLEEKIFSIKECEDCKNIRDDKLNSLEKKWLKLLMK